MECAFCHQAVSVGESFCSACGRAIHRTEAPAEARIVEGSIEPHVEPGDGAELAYMPPRSPVPGEDRALVLAAPVQSALVALARLPALAWQQPAVRSAVKTGASAVALSVALRLATRMLASQGGRQMARQAARDSLLPALAEMLQRGEPVRSPARRGRSLEVTETFIYMRRTIRQ